MTAPKMPDEYKAETLKSGGYVKSTPRKWTQQEIDWIKKLRADGFTPASIAESVDRTEVSVSIKLKRLQKTENTYNDSHRTAKYLVNQTYQAAIKPESVLDCFAGCQPFWTAAGVKKVTTNDINTEFETDYHLDALVLLCQEYSKGNKYDLVDLDPFGSAYDCLDLAIKIARKEICVTLGEMGQKRWHRLDFVRTHYGIETFEDFTTENLVKHIQQIGLRNHKRLVVFSIEKWTNISRVWFTIEKSKTTEQWETA